MKRNLTIAVSFLLIAVISLITPPQGLPKEGMTVIAIFAGCLCLWLFVAIDWPSILCITLIGLSSISTFKEVISQSVGNETFAFLMGTFLCTYAVSQSGVLRQCAIAIIASPLSKKGGWWLAFSFFASVIIIGCFISPTVLFVLFLPILEEIYLLLDIKKGDKIGQMLMMGLAFCTSISSGMTPIAHVFSTMAMGFYKAATGESISYASYMGFAIPVGIICFGIMMAMFKFVLRVDMSSVRNIDVMSLKKDMPPFEQKQLLSTLIFAFVVLLWVGPSFMKGLAPQLSAFITSCGTAFPPFLGVVMLSIVTVKGEPLLKFSEGMSKGVPWSSLIMAGSTLALGAALTSDAAGIKAYLINTLSPSLQNVAGITLVIIFTVWAAIQTNLSSNMVTVTVVTAVAIPLCLASSNQINTAVMVSIIGMMGSYAFATPPAMPHVAIAGSSGWTHTSQMLKYGTILMTASVIVTVFAGYPLGCLFM